MVCFFSTARYEHRSYPRICRWLFEHLQIISVSCEDFHVFIQTQPANDRILDILRGREPQKAMIQSSAIVGSSRLRYPAENSQHRNKQSRTLSWLGIFKLCHLTLTSLCRRWGDCKHSGVLHFTNPFDTKASHCEGRALIAMNERHGLTTRTFYRTAIETVWHFDTDISMSLTIWNIVHHNELHFLSSTEKTIQSTRFCHCYSKCFWMFCL